MRKIFIELAGGLGNQVFQLAAAKHIASESQAKVYAYRSRGFNASSHGNSALGLAPFADIEEKKLTFVVRLIVAACFRLQRRLYWFSVPFLDFAWPKEQGMAPISIRRPVTFIRGYFQASTYLASISLETVGPIKFEGPQAFIRDRFELNPIFVHIRGGDYRLATNPQGLLPATFYREAIALADKESKKVRPLWVFTDDHDYALEVLEDLKWRLSFPEQIYNLNTRESFLAFAQGETVIAANSTFSIASSLLGSANLIIAPDPPFRDLPTPIGFYGKRFRLIRCAWDATD